MPKNLTPACKTQKKNSQLSFSPHKLEQTLQGMELNKEEKEKQVDGKVD